MYIKMQWKRFLSERKRRRRRRWKAFSFCRRRCWGGGKKKRKKRGMGKGQQIMYVRRLLADPVNRDLQLCGCDRESLRSKGMPLYANNVKSWREEKSWRLDIVYIPSTRPEFEDRFERYEYRLLLCVATAIIAAICALTWRWTMMMMMMNELLMTIGEDLSMTVRACCPSREISRYRQFSCL